MTIQTILAVLPLVAVTSLVSAKHLSLWGEGVVPNDDRLRLASYGSPDLDDTAANEVLANNYEVCYTKECKQVADEFLRSMNKSVNPCENIYDFVCGAWSEKDSIPPNEASWSRFMIFRKTVSHRLKGLLEAKPKSIDIRPVRQAKKWYRSCMDTEKLDRRGMNSIRSILTQAGGWPITMDEDEWSVEEYSWQKVELYYARLTGVYTLYRMKVGSPYKDGFLIVESPEIPLTNLLLEHRNYSGNYYNMYLRLVERAAKLIVQNDRTDFSNERISREAKEIVEFDKKIYELKGNMKFCVEGFETFVERYDTNMTELNADPKTKIDWRSLIHELFAMAGTEVISSHRIIVTDCEYFAGLATLLKRTPSRTIVNYIHWNFIAKMLPYTTEWARNELFKFVNKEHGVKERRPRWSECVTDVKMSHAVAYAFVDKYFSKSTDIAVQKMIKYIRIGVEDQIAKSNWLNADSKEWAKYKLKNMKMLIGFPDWYKNKTAVVRRYEGLIISTDYFHNTLNYMRYEAQEQLQRIATVEKLDLWSIIDPITVDAVYAVHFNMLSIPAADLQSPLFAPQLPNNINYAIAGYTIGHEMAHGFDNIGIRYGTGPNGKSLSNDVLTNYEQIEICFLDQFVKYFGADKGRMGSRTCGENIADSAGLQSAFEAYKKMTKALSRVEMRLPGLEEFTDDQLFFVSFAAMWCEVDRSMYEKKKIESEKRTPTLEKDNHSPPKFRVIASIWNSKDFATVFNCPKGNPMNPVDKCNIW